MAKSSSKPSKRNLRSSDSALGDEAWKTRPSAETTSDEGVNARVTRERKRDENTPPRGATAASRKPAASAKRLTKR